MRSFSEAENDLRTLGGMVSTTAPLTLLALSLDAVSGELSRGGRREGLGTIVDPFYAHRHIDFQKELSHETLAQRGINRKKNGNRSPVDIA